jgi:hypothetical protein
MRHTWLRLGEMLHDTVQYYERGFGPIQYSGKYVE